MKIKLLIADDHAIVRYGLNSLLSAQKDMTVVGQAKNGNEAVAQALTTHPDVVIMDLRMPQTDGVTATQRLLARLPDVKVLILTSFGESDGVAHALEAGASGALMKNIDYADLVEAIRSIAGGGTVIAPEIRKVLRESPPIPELTERQREILLSMSRGLTDADIATQLNLTPNSVREHITTIFNKLGAANRAEAVAIALRKHLLKA